MEPEITTQIPSAKWWPPNSSRWGEILSKGEFILQHVFHLSPMYLSHESANKSLKESENSI